MKPGTVCAAVALGGVLAASPAAVAQMSGVFWDQTGPTTYSLYVEVDAPDVMVQNVDLGATILDFAPDGVNNGLFSTNGPITSATLNVPNAFLIARALSISGAGDGSLVDAAWIVGDPSVVDFGSKLGVLIIDVEVNADDVTLGGPGGPGGTTMSSVYVGGQDGSGATLAHVFEIPAVPAPSAAGLLAIAGLAGTRRRR